MEPRKKTEEEKAREAACYVEKYDPETGEEIGEEIVFVW